MSAFEAKLNKLLSSASGCKNEYPYLQTLVIYVFVSRKGTLMCGCPKTQIYRARIRVCVRGPASFASLQVSIFSQLRKYFFPTGKKTFSNWAAFTHAFDQLYLCH
ncbi:hypothetical protein DW036_16570 [Bacteroides sp. AF39-11AC]|jgi:hypothetical protein|nr:hypothetical protein DW036_16570 [Bacteroides sp. AF39-11AC]